MAYNWNAELSTQGKQHRMMQLSLGLSAVSFIVVIAVIAYYLADLQMPSAPAYFHQTGYELRH